MNDDLIKEMRMHHMQMSKNMGVPSHLYQNSSDFIVWYGRFTVEINDREFNMAVTPSTLLVNESDIYGPIAHLTGSEWIETPLGKLFHADYITSKVKGGFQIFRKEDASLFEGFESVSHTHMLVYTDGADEKQYFPVVVTFASE